MILAAIKDSVDQIIYEINNTDFKSMVILGGHYCLSPELEDLSSESETELYSFELGVVTYKSLLSLHKDVTLVLWVNDIGIDKELRKEIKENYEIPSSYKKILKTNNVDFADVHVIFESTSRNYASVHFRKVFKRYPDKFKVYSSNNKSLIRCIEKDNCEIIKDTNAYTIDDIDGKPIVMKEGSNPKCNLILGTLYRGIVNKYKCDTILNIFNDIYIDRIRLGTYVGKKVYDFDVSFLNFFCDEDSIYLENYNHD